MRPIRLQAADVIYHVGSRGVEKRPIFDVFANDRELFLVLLERTIAKYDWLCHAYCLMGNHFHLVLETPKANIAAGMQFLKGDYAKWFNHLNVREGTLFERRYWAKIATSDEYVYELSRYVALNPVRTGWVQAPEEWPWSSYAATIGLVRPPAWLQVRRTLELFGDGQRAVTRFAQFVGEGIGDPVRAAMAIEAMDGV